jgi:hypothetical protein
MNLYSLRNLFFLLVTLTLTSCEVVGDIFKAGMWFAVIAIALVVGLVFFIIGKLRR